PGDAEALAQTGDDRQQRLHIGGVTWPGLGTDRPAVVIDAHPNVHLVQSRTMVLRLAMPAEALTAGAVEHQRGGIEQHDGEIAEQAAPRFQGKIQTEVVRSKRCRGYRT